MKNQNNYKLIIFFFFLLFSNLLSRLFNIEGFNIAFYIIFLMTFVAAVKCRIKDKLNKWQYLILLVFLLYVLDPRYDINANLLTIKDFIIPILALQIGYYFAHSRTEVINKINILFALFIFYALIQEISFYSGVLSNILPWDVRYLKNMAESVDGAQNFSQGGLLRFFGPMNAFVECQIYIVVISLFLLFKKDVIENKKMLTVNILGAIVFLILALERSPILMGAIILFLWKLPLLFKNFARTIRTVLVVTITITIAAISLDTYARNNPMLISAYQRLINVITLNFEEDGSIKDRENRLWSEGGDLARDNSFGIGPGRVTPSAHAYSGYFGPHNNYLLFYLAYGILGFIIFICFLIAAILRLMKQPVNIRLFGFGLILSYCLMAWFNIPFSSKNGILFFLLLGFLVRSSDIKTKKIEANDCRLVN